MFYHLQLYAKDSFRNYIIFKMLRVQTHLAELGPATSTLSKEEIHDNDCIIFHQLRNRCEDLIALGTDELKYRPRITPAERRRQKYDLPNIQRACKIVLEMKDLHACRKLWHSETAIKADWVLWGLKDARKHKAGVERQRYLLNELEKDVTTSLLDNIIMDGYKSY